MSRVAAVAPTVSDGHWFRRFRPPPFEWQRLACGLELLSVEYPAVPIVHLQCTFPAGAQYEPSGKEGLAPLVLSLLQAGTRSRSEREIATWTEARGIEILSRLDWDVASLIVEVPEEDFETGIELFGDLVQWPTFPTSAVTRAVESRAVQLDQQSIQGSFLAEAWFARTAFPHSRYGRPLLGSPQSLRSLGRDDLTTFHRRQYSLSAAQLVTVGSPAADPLMERLAQALPEMEEDPPPSIPPLLQHRVQERRVLLLDLPTAVQTEVHVGMATVPGHHPDATGLEVLARILERRITLTLRERLGHTYAVSGKFLPRRGPTPFVVAAAIGSPHVGDALGEILRELGRLCRNPVAADELGAAKNELLGAFLRALSTSQGVARQLTTLVVRGLSEDLDAVPRRLLDLTSSDLQTLAQRHLSPDAAVIVAAGPAVKLRSRLAGLGPLTEVVEPENSSRDPRPSKP